MAHAKRREKKSLWVSLLAILFCIGIVVILTIFSKPVRRVINLPHQLVQGAQDSRLQDISKETFTKDLTNDTKDQLVTIKEDVLKTTIGDVVTFFGKGQKIPKDLNNLGDQAKKLYEDLPFDQLKYFNK